MHSNGNPTTLRARELRQTANPAEQCLWAALKGRQLAGHKFTRQFPIGPYFADFACREKLLLIEVDGGQHCESDYDQRRDAFLFDKGYAVLRVPSASVLMNREVVCETILAALEGRLENKIDAPDLKYVRSDVAPRKVLRRRVWLAPTPTPPSREG